MNNKLMMYKKQKRLIRISISKINIHNKIKNLTKIIIMIKINNIKRDLITNSLSRLKILINKKIKKI